MFKRKKMRLRKGPLPFRYVVLISFTLFVFITLQGLWLVDRGIEPTLMHVAQRKTEEIASLAINEAIINKLFDSIDMQDILVSKEDKDGNIVYAGVNQQIVNKVQNQSAIVVQEFLKEIEEGRIPKSIESNELGLSKNHSNEPGVIMSIPLGQATENSLLANLGPKIPIKFTIVGDVNTDIEEKIETVGINNTWISINIIVTVKAKVVIPFATETATVTRPIQIMGQFIPGEVPIYYNQSGDPIQPALPIDPNIKDKEDAKKKKEENAEAIEESAADEVADESAE
ncbi:sporulation protein YunB [Fictibacillus arsenicus]|uniref:Sporulation protein YunB n=1 Tax=Fictibacillus arsenicus TaxID=255247 RepID=A0A1B1Z7M3_9BACL|nr:sporulation protein YunB [Fictibacillus arsenicus]ANX13442.1 sporulation protein YunB [Fictibacillus arsenicus]